MRLKPLPRARVHEQRFENVIDPLRGAEHTLHPRPPAPARDDGEVAGPRIACALAVDHDRHAGREVRLTDEQLAPPGKLDDDRF
jgi:hypothetical protein